MGYTHYWRRPAQLSKEQFAEFSADVKKILKVSGDLGIKIANWNGEGTPTIDGTAINFNGLEKCGHREQDLGVAWPAEGASGIASESDDANSGTWPFGVKLSSRQ